MALCNSPHVSTAKDKGSALSLSNLIKNFKNPFKQTFKKFYEMRDPKQDDKEDNFNLEDDEHE